MSEFLSETQGCDLLARLFRARGYSIARNILFREYGVEFHVDGWDAKARVGFEFLSSEDDDHDDLTLSEYQTLGAAQQRGELALFIIDEVEPLSAADLALQATEFLDEVEEARESRRLAGPARKKTAKTKTRAAGTGKASLMAKKAAKKKPAALKKAPTTKAVAVSKAAKPRKAKKTPKKPLAPRQKPSAAKKAAAKKARRSR